MIESDRQHGKPARLYQNTKANIIALGLGAADEGCTAYATDTNEFGAFDGAAWAWSNHDLLGTRHSDTVVNAPTRGSIIIGNATPAWDELPWPATNRHLQTDATDVVWSQNITMINGAWIGCGALIERIVFDSVGGDITVMGANFGVGTAAPGGTVDVAGEIRVTADDAFAANVAQFFTTAASGLVISGHAGTTYDLTLMESGGNILLANPQGTDHVVLCPTSGGDVGVACTPAYRLDVKGSVATYLANFFNDGGVLNNRGIRIQCGADANPATVIMVFTDGDGDTVGYIIGDGAGGVTYGSSSDERLKNILGPIDPAVAMKALAEIDAIQYVGKGLTAKTGRKNLGFSAQEIHKYFPEIATYDEKEDLYGISYERLVSVLWAQNKALLKRIEAGGL